MKPKGEPFKSLDEMYASIHYPERPPGAPPINIFSEAASWDPDEHPDGTPNPYADPADSDE